MLLKSFAVTGWRAQVLDEPPKTTHHEHLLSHKLHLQRMPETKAPWGLRETKSVSVMGARVKG